MLTHKWWIKNQMSFLSRVPRCGMQPNVGLKLLKTFESFYKFFWCLMIAIISLFILHVDQSINSFTNKGSGGYKKLPPRRFPVVRIVEVIRQTTTQFPPQTSSPWCSVCPPYSVDSMNCPNPMRGRPSEGVGRGLLGGVLYKSTKYERH